MEWTKDTVPNGFYRFEKPGCNGHRPVVHVMEIGGKRVVSFINRDYPLPLKEIPPEIKFAQSPISSNFDVPPEEIQGREEELAAYLLEYLQEDPNLRTTRGDKTLCVSRLGTNGKRHYFLLNITLDAIESTVEDEV